MNQKAHYLDGTPEQNRVPCNITDKVLERVLMKSWCPNTKNENGYFGKYTENEYTSYLSLAVEYLECYDIDSTVDHDELAQDVSEGLSDEEWYTADADVLAELMIHIGGK